MTMFDTALRGGKQVGARRRAADAGRDAAAPDGAVSDRLALGWSAGAVCSSLSVNLMGHMLLVFMTSRLGMAPGLAGGLLSINKFLGLGLDPVVGALSDRTKSRMGRRRPWLLAGSIVLPLAMVALFSPPPWVSGTGPQAAYFTAAILLFGAGYSIFRIPYLTMSAEMTSDSLVRARMIAFKIVAIAVGSLLGSSLVPALIDLFGNDRAAYGQAAAVVAAMAMATGLACFFATRTARFAVRPSTSQGSTLANLKSFLSNRPFAALIGAKLLYFFGNTFKGTCAAYFVIFVMRERVSVLGLYFLVLTLMTMFSQPLWLRVVRAWDKRMTFVIAVVAYAVVNLGWLWLVGAPSIVNLAILSAGLGIASGGVQLALEATLPDIMEMDARKTGLRREGAFAAIFSLMEKLTSALGLAAVGAYLQFSGFIQSTKDVVQPASAIHAISMAMTVIPSAAAALAAVMIYLWGLRAADRAAAAAAS